MHGQPSTVCLLRVYACVCLVCDRFVYLLESVCVCVWTGGEGWKLTDCRTALIWLDTELEACVCGALALGQFCRRSRFWLFCCGLGELTMPLRTTKCQQKYESPCDRIRVHVQVGCCGWISMWSCTAGSSQKPLRAFLKNECYLYISFPSVSAHLQKQLHLLLHLLYLEVFNIYS